MRAFLSGYKCSLLPPPLTPLPAPWLCRPSLTFSWSCSCSLKSEDLRQLMGRPTGGQEDGLHQRAHWWQLILVCTILKSSRSWSSFCGVSSSIASPISQGRCWPWRSARKTSRNFSKKRTSKEKIPGTRTALQSPTWRELCEKLYVSLALNMPIKIIIYDNMFVPKNSSKYQCLIFAFVC